MCLVDNLVGRREVPMCLVDPVWHCDNLVGERDVPTC